VVPILASSGLSVQDRRSLAASPRQPLRGSHNESSIHKAWEEGVTVKITTISEILRQQRVRWPVGSEAQIAVRQVAVALSEEFLRESTKFDERAFLDAVGEVGNPAPFHGSESEAKLVRPARKAIPAKRIPPQDSTDDRAGCDFYGHIYRTDWSLALNYALALQHKFPDYVFKVESGRKFDKIVKHRKGQGFDNGSVHCFINKERKSVLKAASFSAPQKEESHISGFAERYKIGNFYGFNSAINAADENGAYLYKKTRTRKY
jgi:hypothetical protein